MNCQVREIRAFDRANECAQPHCHANQVGMPADSLIQAAVRAKVLAASLSHVGMLVAPYGEM